MTEPIRVIVNGAKGRMGQEAVKAITAEKDLQVVAETDVGDDLSETILRHTAQVVVDFTTAAAGYKNCRQIIAANARPVIGTSGLLLEQVKELQVLAKAQGLGGLIAPNFAIGAVLMMKFAKEASRYFPEAEIIELHHDKKADAPSGTALKTSIMMAEGRQQNPSVRMEDEILPGARGATNHQVHIHSVRLPGFVAHQEVLFGGKSEILSIRHDSLHRESFMPGVVFSCRKVVSLTELVYGLENLL